MKPRRTETGGRRRSSRHEAPALDAEAARQRLQHAAEILGIGLAAIQVDRLLAYAALLQRWNRVYNLSGLREAEEILGQHLIDCLAVLPAFRRHANRRALRVLDVGSGGGLPGVVLAIAQPDWSVACVDAVAKKAGFVRQVGVELALPNLGSLHARVEALPAQAGRFELITSRAFASLADFTALSASALANDGVWVAMKAAPTTQELTDLPGNVEVFHVEQLRVPGLDAQRCLVWMQPRRTGTDNRSRAADPVA